VRGFAVDDGDDDDDDDDDNLTILDLYTFYIRRIYVRSLTSWIQQPKPEEQGLRGAVVKPYADSFVPRKGDCL